jgi:N-acylneuraminate cytidylyltransferase/CMP-N,N'-diacetyllegionaminic acid synthase
MDILFLMTARGGSKGVPLKNLRRIDGLSLIGYKAGGARQSSHCSKIYLSTDDKDIQAEAVRHGVAVPFTRPAELATDTASSADVVDHAMDYIERVDRKYDAIMLLEPSTPFTRPRDYDAAVELMLSTNADAVVGMRKTSPHSTFVGELGPKGDVSAITRKMAAYRSSPARQDLPTEYTMNGALYLFGWDYFRAHRNIYHPGGAVFGLPMPTEVSIEIDDLDDLAFAEFLVSGGRVRRSDYVLTEARNG